jgi:hypothetical protein
MVLVFKDVFLSSKEYSWICVRLLLKRNKWNSASTLFLLFLSVISWVFFLVSPQFRTNVLAGDAWGAIVLLAIGILLPFSYWRIYRRSYNSTAFLQAPASYVISENGIQATSPLVQSQASWQTATQLYLLRPYAVLMNSNLTGYFLDFRCLETPATEADLMALARQHHIPVK